MAKRSGFTLVELMIAVSIMSVVLGVIVALYVFTANRAAHAMATSNTISQVQDLSEAIDKIVINAVKCEVVEFNGFKALKCTMPKNASDSDGDGIVDTFTPYTVSRRGIEKYGEGKRIWFYLADSTGKFATSGVYVWRSERNDDNYPASTDKVSNFSYYYNGSIRKWFLIDSVAFSVDSSKQVVTYTIKAMASTRNQELATSDGQQTRTSTLTREVYWRNHRR